jgi:hypothetical protein
VDVPFEAETLKALAEMTSFFTQFAGDSATRASGWRNSMPRWGAKAAGHQLAIPCGRCGKSGRLAHAKQVLNRALEQAVALRLRVTTARIRRHLGYVEFELGNFEQSRVLSQEAHDLALAIPDRAVDAMASWNLSRLDALAGDLESAVARSVRSLDLARTIPFRPVSLHCGWVFCTLPRRA